MKRLFLLIMLSALMSGSFAQQRRTTTAKTTARTSINNKEVEKLNDSILILNNKIEELNDRVKDLQKRLGVKPIAERTGNDGTLYKIIKCEGSTKYKSVKVFFQVVNHQDRQILKLNNEIGIRSDAIIDGNKVDKPNIYSGGKSISGKIDLKDKNIVTNFELSFYVHDDKIHKTVNSLTLKELNSGSELHFTELPITTID